MENRFDRFYKIIMEELNPEQKRLTTIICCR